MQFLGSLISRLRQFNFWISIFFYSKIHFNESRHFLQLIIYAIQNSNVTSATFHNWFSKVNCHFNFQIDPLTGVVSRVKRLDAKSAAPRSFRRLFDGRLQAVHVVAPVAVVAEEELVVVLGGAAERAALALDALPRVLPHGDQHVVGELKASRVTWNEKKGSG